MTTKLKQMVLSFQFAGTGPDDLTTGLSPFLVTYAGARDYYQAQQETASVTQHQLDQGTQNASFADIQAIKASEKVRFLSDLHQTGNTLQHFAVLAQVFLRGAVANSTHLSRTFGRLPMVSKIGSRSFWIVITVWRATHHSFTILLAYFGPFRSSRMSICRAPSRQQQSVVETLIPVRSSRTDLQRGTYHASNSWISLPSEYLTAPAVLPPVVITAPALAATVAAGGGNALSIVSGLTTAAPPRTAAGTASATQTRVPNPAPDAAFQTLNLRPRLGDLLRVHRPPQNDAGVEFCVSWWCKGACYWGCSRHRAHTPFASPGERARLLQHVTTHLVTPEGRGHGSGALVPALWCPPLTPRAKVPPPLATTRQSTSSWIPVETSKQRRKLAAPMASTAEITLGKWAMAAAERMSTVGWGTMVAELRGASNITATVGSIPHKAGRLLDVLRKIGAGVLTSTPPWSAPDSPKQRIEALTNQRPITLSLCVRNCWTFVSKAIGPSSHSPPFAIYPTFVSHLWGSFLNATGARG